MLRLRARVLTPISPTQTRWLDDAQVQIDDQGQLVAVDPWPGGPCDEDLRPRVLTPGFVDVHSHAPQTQIIGAASGPLLQWLKTSTFPAEAAWAQPAVATQVSRAFAAALAAAGTTLSMVYGSVHAAAGHALFSAMDQAGLRTIAGPVLMDQGAPQDLLLPTEAAMASLDSLVDRWHGHDGRLQVAVIPRFALTCSAPLLAAAGAFAADHGLWVSTHISENTDECAATTELFDAADYLQVYERAGLIHDKTVLAHCVHLSDSEWDRLASAGAVVAHCPDSNDFLGSGGMPLAKVTDRGLPLGLGTDVAAGRSFRVPRIASSAHDNALRQGLRPPPAAWLWAATRGGALALQQPQLGLLAPGLAADMVLHDLPAWVQDGDAALAWILFHHDAPQPRRTWVAGNVVWDRNAHQAAGGLYPWDLLT